MPAEKYILPDRAAWNDAVNQALKESACAITDETMEELKGEDDDGKH